MSPTGPWGGVEVGALPGCGGVGGHYPGLLHGWGYSRYYMCATRNNSVVNRG